MGYSLALSPVCLSDGNNNNNKTRIKRKFASIKIKSNKTAREKQRAKQSKAKRTQRIDGHEKGRRAAEPKEWSSSSRRRRRCLSRSRREARRNQNAINRTDIDVASRRVADCAADDASLAMTMTRAFFSCFVENWQTVRKKGQKQKSQMRAACVGGRERKKYEESAATSQTAKIKALEKQERRKRKTTTTPSLQVAAHSCTTRVYVCVCV